MLAAFIAGLFGAADGPPARDLTEEYWWNIAETSPGDLYPTAARRWVTDQTALGLPAAFACIRILAESIGALPCRIFERTADGATREAVSHPLTDVLCDRPNDVQTALEFREQMTARVASTGNAVAEIVPGARGAVDRLVPIAPGRVRWEVPAGNRGRPIYQVTDFDGRVNMVRNLTVDEVMHLRGLVLAEDNVTGLSPIAAARETIGAGLAAQEYGSRFFGNDSQAGGYIELPGRPNAEVLAELRRQWMLRSTGSARHGIRFLYDGAKFSATTVSNEDSQFIETRKLNAIEVAMIYRIPPPLLQILDNANYSNVVALDRAFVVHSLLPWLVRWEQAIKRDLITAPRFFVKFDVGALLRGDFLTRLRGYAIGRNWGWYSVDEIRGWEGLNPIGEDWSRDYLRPGNMVPAGDPAEPSGMGGGGDGGREDNDDDRGGDPARAPRPNGQAGRLLTPEQIADHLAGLSGSARR